MRNLLGSIPGFAKTAFSTIVGAGIGAAVGTLTPMWLIGGGAVGWLLSHGLEKAQQKWGHKLFPPKPVIDADFRVLEANAQPQPSARLLELDFDANDPQCVMIWKDQERLVQGLLLKYSHTVFRVRVRNTSPMTTLKGVSVLLDRVVSLHTRHPSVLHGHPLNVAHRNVDSADIAPLQTLYFDVVAHERENENAHPINDLFFRYAGVSKESPPTDPGVSFTLCLKAQPLDGAGVAAHFRVSIDEGEFARFQPAAPPPATGIEPICEAGKPYEEANYHDSTLDEGGHLYRIGLRSLDKGKEYRAKVEIESMEGAIKGGYTNRPLRFKDCNGAEANVAYGTGPTAFVEFLLSSRFGPRSDRLLYATKPQYGDEVEVDGPFSIRFRITGAPNATYVTIRFLRDILGFPHPVGYDIE
jgi:hypothetical protein